MDIALIWYGIIGLAILIYVILDGFDLGIGILFPFASNESERDMMMNSIAPVWDGNETWLVLGGGGLFAVFPLAYSVAMPAFYAPLIIMLLGLVLRGVSFEYRFKTKRGKFLWDAAFFLGSLSATVTQGIMLGTLLQGIDIEGRSYAGGWFDWLTPFTLFCGLATTCAYTLLGGCWLMMKLPEDLAARYDGVTKRWAVGLVLCIALVSIWLPLTNTMIYSRWFDFPHSLFYLSVPISAAVLVWLLFRALINHKPLQAYLLGVGLFLIAASGFALSTFPYIIPFSVTYRDAAAPNSSLVFLLVGTIVLLPTIIGYSAYAYWIFRGRLKSGEGYH
jgi:cytochrome d ubiquinol oxidase subunit II